MNNNKVKRGQAGFAAAGAIILVALGIMALIAASYYSNIFSGSRSLTASIGDFLGSPNLEETVKTIVSDLGNVQARSKTGVDGVAWGVCFRNISDPESQDTYEVVSNITSVNNPCDIGRDGSIESIIKIPGDISISDPGQGSSRYVTFRKVTGATTSSTNLNFTFTDGQDFAIITITPAGVITYSNSGFIATQNVPVNNTPIGGSSVLTAPSAPQHPASASGVGRVAIAWSAPAFTGGSAIIEYRVFRSTSAFDPNMAIVGSVPFPGTVFVDTNVITGVTYFYRLDARNSVGASAQSAQVSAASFAPQPTTTFVQVQNNLPSEPWNLQATPGNNKVTLSWSAPLSTGSSPIIDYRVYRSTVSGGAQTLVKTTSTLSTTNTGLVGGVTYFYKVEARNSAGAGLKSAQVSVTPNSDTQSSSNAVPSAPRNVVAKAGFEEVTLTWSAPSSNASSVNEYRVYYGYDARGSKYDTGYDGSSRKFTHTGLTNGDKYYYVVVALNDLGESAQSNEVSATPRASSSSSDDKDEDKDKDDNNNSKDEDIDCGSLEAPRNLKAVANGDNVTLTWSAPEIEDGCDEIVNYTISRLDPTETDPRKKHIVGYPDGDDLKFIDKDVPSNANPYHYWISAYNGSDRSNLSSQAIVVVD